MTTKRQDTPNYYNRADAYRKEIDHAAAVYASRKMGIVEWMHQPNLLTMWDYACHLCAEFGIINPDNGLLRRIVGLASRDY